MGQIQELTQEITYNNPMCPSRSYTSPLWCHVKLYHSMDIKSPLHMHQVQLTPFTTAIIRTKQEKRPSSNGLPTLSYTGAMALKS